MQLAEAEQKLHTKSFAHTHTHRKTLVTPVVQLESWKASLRLTTHIARVLAVVPRLAVLRLVCVYLMHAASWRVQFNLVSAAC